MQWLLMILRQAGPAAIGYFINDVATFFGKMLPSSIQSKVVDGKGGWSWWYILLLFIVLVGALFFIIKLIMPRGKKSKGIFVLGGLCALAEYYFGVNSDVIMATNLVTLTTGAAVTTTATLAFLPERIAFAAATQLSGVKVSVQGDGVVFDSDANGITHIGVNRVIGQVTNNYILTLANSLVPAKNVLFEFINSAAQTPTVLYDSDSKPVEGVPPMFCQMSKQPILVGGNDFTNFLTLSLPSLAATDSITILYNDGTVQANMNRNDIQYRLGYTQNVVNTPVYTIDNANRLIKSVTVVAGAAQTAYMQQWTPSLRGVAVPG